MNDVRQILDQLPELSAAEAADADIAVEWLLHQQAVRATARVGTMHHLSERLVILRCTDKGSHPSRHIGEIFQMGADGDLFEFAAGDTQRFSERPRRDISGVPAGPQAKISAFRPRCPSCRLDRPLSMDTLRRLFSGLDRAGRFDTRNSATVDLSLIPATFEGRS